ncbi:hemerythrin domain-containing protein [Pyxidicoccus fallax]|uniref:Hemerythrin domain-containing protein n=1 Tax=Pyxidicoccus fallax TaxID=394095 RepID=A0A848LEM8_9BACT|nr:hemerythrin domain-containing protein [Pyxidicoccus fallax]NMO17187.1 hemerythrin domain-containing protein [Pyxidicoccus fallax]NPC80471.1 hemerythrin domain-containing protein [Pyxidicoccus fallax]
MLGRVDALKEEHGRLRALLGQCESAPALELSPLLAQLREQLRPHLQAKQSLYVQAVEAIQTSGTPTELSLLGIFRTNLSVVSGAVMGFLDAPDPHPERLRERLRTVVGALRSLLDTEEKVVFPLCTRYSKAAGTGAAPHRSRFEEGRR